MRNHNLKSFLTSVLLRRFRKSTAGNVAVIISLVSPAMLMVFGTGLEYSYVSTQKSSLQQAVDAAVIAAAREMSLSDAGDSRLSAVGKTVLLHNMNGKSVSGLSVKIGIGAERKSLKMNAAIKVDQIFDFDFLKLDTVQVSAEARIFGNVRVCAIGLNNGGAGAIMLDKNARMTGVGCAVFSNSLNSVGLQSKKNANLKASLICSAGGFNGGKANFSPEPMTDCPPFDDPLSKRPEPFVGSCTHKNLVVTSDRVSPTRITRDNLSASKSLSSRTPSTRKTYIITNGRVSLKPGIYCGGLTIEGNADVTLTPGLYIMKDGPLLVRDKAKLSGQYVGFYYTGAKAVFDFKSDTTIDLSAPKNGMMTGLLMFEGRRGKAGEKHNISSNNARNLLGTIYLPRGQLYIDANAPVADTSAYTVVIANKINLYEGPHLILNTNYGDTDIPVPDGIKGAVRNVMLSK